MIIFTKYQIKWLTKTMLIAFFVVASNANVYSQKKVIVFPEQDISIEKALEQIENQTGYLISSNYDDIDLSNKVILTDKELALDDALSQILVKSGYVYLIRGKYILITPSKFASTRNQNEPIHQLVVSQDSAIKKTLEVVDSLSGILKNIKAEYVLSAPEPPKIDINDYYSYLRLNGDLEGKFSYNKTMPKIALRTNLLYGFGTLTPNVGLELGLGYRSTLLISGSYNGWNEKGLKNNNKKLCHWIVESEYRYWLCEKFNGHFFGLHGYYGYYNISGVKIPFVFGSNSDKHRYKGYVLGAGVSYGYQLLLGKRWNLEFNAGFGFGYANYDKWDCIRCGEKVAGKVGKTFAAPTKLGVSLVFIIK